VIEVQKRVRLVGEVADHDSAVAGTILPPVDAHTGAGAAIRVGDSFRDTDFHEAPASLAVALVVKEEIARSVVGHDDIGPAILIQVAGDDPERLAYRADGRLSNADASAAGNVFEAAATEIAVEKAVRPLEAARLSVGPYAGRLVVVAQI